jgi:hypothetical protein
LAGFVSLALALTPRRSPTNLMNSGRRILVRRNECRNQKHNRDTTGFGMPTMRALSQLLRQKLHQPAREDAGTAAGLVDRTTQLRAKKPACLSARSNASEPGTSPRRPANPYKTGHSGSVAAAGVRHGLIGASLSAIRRR